MPWTVVLRMGLSGLATMAAFSPIRHALRISWAVWAFRSSVDVLSFFAGVQGRSQFRVDHRPVSITIRQLVDNLPLNIPMRESLMTSMVIRFLHICMCVHTCMYTYMYIYIDIHASTNPEGNPHSFRDAC